MNRFHDAACVAQAGSTPLISELRWGLRATSIWLRLLRDIDVLAELLLDLAIDLVQVLVRQRIRGFASNRFQRVSGKHCLEPFNAVQDILFSVPLFGVDHIPGPELLVADRCSWLSPSSLMLGLWSSCGVASEWPLRDLDVDVFKISCLSTSIEDVCVAAHEGLHIWTLLTLDHINRTLLAHIIEDSEVSMEQELRIDGSVVVVVSSNLGKII